MSELGDQLGGMLTVPAHSITRPVPIVAVRASQGRKSSLISVTVARSLISAAGTHHSW
jgi:hypothetical protein